MRKKFGFLDVLIVVLIIALSLGAYLILKSEPEDPAVTAEAPATVVETPAESVTIRYQVLFESKEEFVADALMAVPDEVFFYDTDDLTGTLISKQSQSHYDTILNKDTNEVIKVEHPGIFDVSMTFETVALKNGDGKYKIGSMEINEIKYLNFKGKHFFTSGIIHGIEEVNNG